MMAASRREVTMAGGADDGFGALLRRHRLLAGLTQEGLAERAGVSARAVSDLERGGGRAPRLETVGLLAGALALSGEQRAALLAAARPDAGDPVRPAPPPSAPTGTVPGPPPLFGRHHERVRLRAALDAALAGRGGLALIGGEAGIGKTALAGALLHEAADRGCVVLEGRCFDLAETPPYGPWIDLFLHLPAADLPPLPPAFAQRGTVGPVPSQLALLAQVEDFLRAVAARRPVALLLDDLHWADPASLDLLRFLARSVATLPLVVIVTYRPDEVGSGHPLSPLLPQLAREPATVRLDLTRLDDGAVRALADARHPLPDADAARLVAYLRARADGNALFVGELLRALEEAGVLRRGEGRWALGGLGDAAVPALLRRVIEGRVARLDDGAQAALGAAAVIGQEVPFAVWATVSGTDEEAITGGVEQAATARLMEETADGTGARFLHALIREALYEGLLPSRRRRLHRAAGEALAALPEPDADAVAHHFRIVGDARAVEWLARAGERARAAFAYATAVERMKEAVALLDQPGDAAMAAGLCVQVAWILRFVDRQQAFRYAEEAVKRAAAADDPVLLGMARCCLANNHWLAGDPARGIAELRAAVAELEALPPAAWEHTATPRWYIAALVGDRSSTTDVRVQLALPLAAVGACREVLALLGGTLDLDAAALATATEDKLLTLRIVAEYLGRPDIAKRAFAAFGHLTRAAEDWYRLGNQTIAFLGRTVLPYSADDRAFREEVAGAAAAAWGRAQALHLVAPFPVPAGFPRRGVGCGPDARRLDGTSGRNHGTDSHRDTRHARAVAGEAGGGVAASAGRAAGGHED